MILAKDKLEVLEALLPREIIEALDTFLGAGKPAGRVVIDFRNGGCAGVEISRKLK